MTTPTDRDKETARRIAVKWLTTPVQGRDMRRTLTDAIATALAAERARIIPDGWKLVPVEPTMEMDEAGCQANATMPTRTNSANVAAVWAAMLAAAPPPEREKGNTP